MKTAMAFGFGLAMVLIPASALAGNCSKAQQLEEGFRDIWGLVDSMPNQPERCDLLVQKAHQLRKKTHDRLVFIYGKLLYSKRRLSSKECVQDLYDRKVNDGAPYMDCVLFQTEDDARTKYEETKYVGHDAAYNLDQGTGDIAAMSEELCRAAKLEKISEEMKHAAVLKSTKRLDDYFQHQIKPNGDDLKNALCQDGFAAETQEIVLRSGDKAIYPAPKSAQIAVSAIRESASSVGAGK